MLQDRVDSFGSLAASMKPIDVMFVYKFVKLQEKAIHKVHSRARDRNFGKILV